MIIAKITGGLGNQMFQYAYAYYLAKKNRSALRLDLTFYKTVYNNVTPRKFELPIFSIPLEEASEEEIRAFVPLQDTFFSKSAYKIKNWIGGRRVIKQPNDLGFNPSFISAIGNLYLAGYWQSEKYFKEVESSIRKFYSFSAQDYKTNENLLNLIKKGNSISIHVRRGDYITNKGAEDFHGICDLSYYMRSIDYIGKSTENPVFFLFTDDLEWVKENFKLKFPFYIVDQNRDQSYLDMMLMSNCKHNIIANSSFSWWGAWLNSRSDKIVVAPKRWFAANVNQNDMVPDNWIRL